MPSIIGYAALAKKFEKKSDNQAMIRLLVNTLRLKMYSDKSPEEIATYLHTRGYMLASKVGITLEDYYSAVSDMLSKNMIPFDCAKVQMYLTAKINHSMESIKNELEGGNNS